MTMLGRRPSSGRPASQEEKMGVFDFVRNAGAKIGIGESPGEIAAEEQARVDAQAAEAAERQNSNREKMRARAQAKRSAANAEKRAESRKSVELERYIRDMDLEVSGLDIRFDDGTAYIDGEAADSEIFEANKPMLTDPDLIFPGQVLRIPQ
ncbi:MAG: nucleoid-associated protein YgaU [Verrucomicrobiales bacterium]|jgi:nucleoid-associated protein YgaU